MGTAAVDHAIAAAGLALCFAAGCALTLAGAIGLAGQTQTLLFVAYLVGFAVILPLACAVAAWPSMAARRGAALRSEALAAAVLTVAVLCLLRAGSLLDVSSARLDLAVALAGVALIALTLLAATGRAPALGRLGVAIGGTEGSDTGRRRAAIAVSGAILVVLVFAPAEVGAAAVAAALAGGGLVAALARRPISSPPRWAGTAADVVLLALVALLVVDLSGYWGDDVTSVGSTFLTRPGAGVQIHQHFFLGAVNDVLNGRALLVDANSVYGIGNAYLIALFFEAVPIGYGTFTLFGALMTLLVLYVGWLIGRLVGVPRPLLACVLLVAVIVSVLDPIYAPTLYSNLGGLRFIAGYAVALAAVVAAGRGRPASLSPPVLLTLGFFSTWSVESLTYATGAYLAILAADAVGAATLREAARRIASGLALALAACLAVHLVFALVTLAASGGLPDWTRYLSLFSAWSDIVATAFSVDPAEPWSRGWLIGAVYVATAIGIVVARRSPRGNLLPERALVALAGLTGAGIGMLSYFVAHTLDLYLLYVAFPALLIPAIWWAPAAGSGAPSDLSRRLALGFAAFVGLLLLLGSWSTVGDRYPSTALAHLVPGGSSFAEDAERLWDLPPLAPGTAEAERLLDRYFPEDEALVLVEPDVGTEALLRSGRANLLPISYPWQDEVDPDTALPPVEEAIAALRPGTLALLQRPPGPGAEPTVQQLFGNVPPGERLGPLAQEALDLIQQRFELETVAEGGDGLYVVRLVEPSARG